VRLLTCPCPDYCLENPSLVLRKIRVILKCFTQVSVGVPPLDRDPSLSLPEVVYRCEVLRHISPLSLERADSLIPLIFQFGRFVPSSNKVYETPDFLFVVLPNDFFNPGGLLDKAPDFQSPYLASLPSLCTFSFCFFF